MNDRPIEPSGPSAKWAMILAAVMVAAAVAFNADGPGGDDRPTSGCDFCDEFTEDGESIRWRWGNQGAVPSSSCPDGFWLAADSHGLFYCKTSGPEDAE